MQSRNIKAWALASTLLSGGGVIAIAQPALAQTVDEQEAEIVTVTGTRIARPDYVADSPVLTVSGEAVVANADITIAVSGRVRCQK